MLAAAFTGRERRATRPLADPALLADPRFTRGTGLLIALRRVKWTPAAAAA